jgi:hypothetical protein
LKAAAEAGFDVLVTGDKTLQHEQNLGGRSIAIVLLSANSWRVIEPHASLIVAAIDGATPGSFTRVKLRNVCAPASFCALTRSSEDASSAGRRQFSVPDAVGDNFDRQTLGVADDFLASRAVSHHTGQFQCLGDPAAGVVVIELNRQIHEPL